MWLNDAILMQFGRMALSDFSTNSGSRFLLISSQAMVPAGRVTEETKATLQNWLDGVDMHNLLWHICINSHWSLKVVDISTFCVWFRDPFEPGHSMKTDSGIRETALYVLTEKMEDYRKKYRSIQYGKRFQLQIL